MSVRRSLIPILLLAVSVAAPARAEVSAVTDGFGTYIETVVLTNPGVRRTKIWTVQRAKLGYHPVNTSGDRTGDGYPLIADDWSTHTAWVVWTRPNGSDLDLLWSRWSLGGWSPVAYVQDQLTLGDDSKPAITFDGDSRPYMVWERVRTDGTPGGIYMTVFLESVWMEEFLVSDPLVDSLRPTIEMQSDKTFLVEFDTPDGRMNRLVTIDLPVSINDDITPMGYVTVSPSRPIDCGGPR